MAYDDFDPSEFEKDELDDRGRPKDKSEWTPSMHVEERKDKREAKKANLVERENAFLKAGLDTDDERVQVVMRGYDGEPTKEAIQSIAQKMGLLAPPAVDPNATAPVDGMPPADAAAQQRIQAAATGATAPQAGDPWALAEAELTEAMDTGGPEAMMRKAQELGMQVVTG